jgi:dethiobiotin synthetase
VRRAIAPHSLPPRRAGGLFVSGTDTGAGKTALSAALLAAIARAGSPVRAHKPVVTGLDEPGGWPCDHELLAQMAGMRAEAVAPVRYGPAVSPHLAAELAGDPLDYGAILSRARAALAAAETRAATLVVEGVGGLLSPLTDTQAVRELAVDLALPVVLAARPGLGTINHSLLTLEAARAAGLTVKAVVLTPWPREPSVLERSNRTTIARRGQIEVCVLPTIGVLDEAELAHAGANLPWRRWLADGAPHTGSAASREPRGRGACAEPARAAATTAAPTLATSSSSITKAGIV